MDPFGNNLFLGSQEEDADGVTRARPTEGAAVASDAYIIWKVALSESQPPSRGWMW